jgi:hypothetical protein
MLNDTVVRWAGLLIAGGFAEFPDVIRSWNTLPPKILRLGRSTPHS